MDTKTHFFLLFFLLFSQVSYASEIQINPDTVTLFQNVSIDINVTGNPGDTWKLVIIKPDGTNETVDSGTLDASGTYTASYTYNTTTLGTHYADVFVNDTVNSTNAWTTYENASKSSTIVAASFSLSFDFSNSTKSQNSSTPAFSLKFYSVNGSQNLDADVPAFSLEFGSITSSQTQHAFVPLIIKGYIHINLYINSTFVAPDDVLKIYGDTIVYFENGTIANASNAETHVYIDGIEYFLDPSTGLISPEGTQALTTNPDGTFEFYFVVRAKEGVHDVNVTIFYANYSGTNATYFIIPKITISLIPQNRFVSYDNSTSWAYGTEDILYGVAKEGFKPSETLSSPDKTELNFSYRDRAYIVFSKNDPAVFKKRAEMAKTAELFEYPRPTFAYTLGRTYIIRIILEYRNADIEGDEVFHAGVYNMRIQHSPKGNNVVTVRRV